MTNFNSRAAKVNGFIRVLNAYSLLSHFTQNIPTLIRQIISGIKILTHYGFNNIRRNDETKVFNFVTILSLIFTQLEVVI